MKCPDTTRSPKIIMHCKLLINLLFILLLTTASHASLTESEQQAVAKRQLAEMNAALKGGDVNTFISYINPGLVRRMGGADSLRKEMKTYAKEVGEAIRSISIGEPSKIFHKKNQLQCLISDTVCSAFDYGPSHIVENVIAISDDGGGHWTFANCGNSREKFNAFKTVIPKLAPELEKMLEGRLRGE